MKKSTYLIALTSLASLALAPLAQAQDDDAAAAQAATTGQTLLKPEDLKWNKDLMWINIIVNEGGVTSTRGYFGAVTKQDFNSLVGGTYKGMVQVKQCFYFNASTRLFSRFDAPQPGAAISLYGQDGYFRQESIMRVVELNKQFVENLAIRGFVKVEGN